jgi:hypothetical protein
MRKPCAAVVVMTFLGTPAAFAAETRRAPEEQSVDVQGPAGTDGGGEIVVTHPEPRPQPRPAQGTLSAPASDPLRRGASAPGEKTLRALVAVEVREGEARLLSAGAPLTLRVGDTFGGDVVRRVDVNRIVLRRLEGEGREATVIVTFDAQKRARVLVFRTTDPTAVEAPTLR